MLRTAPRTLALSLLALLCTWGQPGHVGAGRTPRLPEGRAIADLGSPACLRVLRSQRVEFERYRGDASGVRDPVLLRGPLGGVEVEYEGRREQHAVLDCRLVVALLRWAPVLRAAHVAAIRHISVYRGGAVVGHSSRPSGHAAGLAIDVRYLRLDDGTELDVLTDWGDRTRDAPPCDAYPDEPAQSAMLRSIVCQAVAQDLFQTVVTPHHNAEHQNHVHLEVVPDVDWTWVH